MSREGLPVIRVARRVHASRAVQAHENGSDDCGEGGFTLVELLVAISIFALLTAVVFSGLTATVKTVDDVRSVTNLTEEARMTMERMTRELRQSTRVLAANGTSVTFGVDFNSVRGLEKNAVDPEIVRYQYAPGINGKGTLMFIANNPDVECTSSQELLCSPVERPILKENVKNFALTFSSNLSQYNDQYGLTDWTAIDLAIGNHNGIFDLGEFNRIDSIEVTIQLNGSGTQTYTTRAYLRNQNQKLTG